MNEDDPPERRFVVGKHTPVMRPLETERDQPNMVVGAEQTTIAFFGDILRWLERRRTAKARKRQVRANK